MIHLALVGALALPPPTLIQVKNYAQVICDEEPDPVQCEKVHYWYLQAKSNQRTSCCGVADAYWADETKKVTNLGVFVTVTDRRDCEYAGINPKAQYEDDGEGGVSEVPNTKEACISGRVLRDGQTVFIPNDVLDKLKQGNPTGHQVVFISAGSLSNYLDDGVMYPSVICAFPGFTG